MKIATAQVISRVTTMTTSCFNYYCFKITEKERESNDDKLFLVTSTLKIMQLLINIYICIYIIVILIFFLI